MRVLIAFEDNYRVYREMIAAAIEMMRPRAVVVSTEVNKLETEARLFVPHVIICSVPRIVNHVSALAWIELSPDPQQGTRIWIEERYEEALDPGMGDIVSVIDEVETLVGV
jgi:hypothetical protein